MQNIEKYNQVFIEVLNVNEEDLSNLKYQDGDWDSVGHMSLMTALEDAFLIEMDADDIIDFSSYQVGKELLAKYNIEL